MLYYIIWYRYSISYNIIILYLPTANLAFLAENPSHADLGLAGPGAPIRTLVHGRAAAWTRGPILPPTGALRVQRIVYSV